MAKKKTYESPLSVDDPMALYRVHCPACRQNVWADNEPPPVEGEVILEQHTCVSTEQTPASAEATPDEPG